MPPIVLSLATETLTRLITALPAAVNVPFTVTLLGAVAVMPPVNAKVPVLAPNARVPVLLKVTALVIVPVVAFNARL